MSVKTQPVDVISVCSADGNISPLRIQLKDQEHQVFRINIDQIVSCKQIPYVGVEAQIFRCRATVWNRRCTFELKYTFRSHSWQLLGEIQ